MPQKNENPQNLMMRVAKRVRAVRKLQGLPRRALSEKSGVSPRYLAQLEAGEGNVSITLLQRIAFALDLDPAGLLAETSPLEEAEVQLLNRFRVAGKETQKAVLGLLGVDAPSRNRAGRICLVGLRGAGKSTLGRLAADALGLPFVELKNEIESETGMPVSEVMALYGADGYRSLEAEALRRVSENHDRLVLAVAGGIVSEKETYDLLLEQFHSIWLFATAGEHMERVRAQGDLRPMEGRPSAMSQLRALIDARQSLYERAEAHLNTSNRSVATSLNDLLATIASHGFLDQ